MILRATTALVLGFALTACSPCLTRSDCERGQYCEFTSGECRTACTSAADCGGRTVCDQDKGQCVLPAETIPRDAGTATSTATDGG